MGAIEAIGIRPGRREEVKSVDHATILNSGIVGDHYDKSEGSRSVTLIGKEGLLLTWERLGRTDSIDHNLTRRNLLISGIDLREAIGKQIRIGENVLLEITGKCHPCRRMEENLGKGGTKALAENAGVTARVLEEGDIRPGDQVRVV